MNLQNVIYHCFNSNANHGQPWYHILNSNSSWYPSPTFLFHTEFSRLMLCYRTYPHHVYILHDGTTATTASCQTTTTTTQRYIVTTPPLLRRRHLHIHDLWLLQMCWVSSLSISFMCTGMLLSMLLVRPIGFRWQFMRMPLWSLSVDWLRCLSVLVRLSLVGLMGVGRIACIGGRRRFGTVIVAFVVVCHFDVRLVKEC